MIDVARPRQLASCAVLAVLASLPASAQEIQLVPGSTIPRVQLSGEHFQIESDGVYFAAPTPSATLSRFGVSGTDLGHPLTIGDRIWLFFGDTVGAYRSGDRYYSSRGIPAGAGDSIGYLPNTDFSQCRYIQGVAEQIASGVAAPVGDATGCPELSFLLNPLRAADEHRFKPLVISGLDADEAQGVFRVPTSVLYHNDRVYVFATTKYQDSKPAGAFWLQSVAARSDQSPALWSDTTPPSFSKLYTVSTHAPVEDPANPPPIETDGGKFMAVPSVVMTAGALADLRLTRFLPRELQTADVIFLWGRGWNATTSDMYLAAVSLDDVEAGTSKWFYYAGPNKWSSVERDAVGLLRADDVSQHSVTWNAALGRFVLMRGETRRIVAQFAAAPWGPWSAPITVVDGADPWLQRLLHRPGADRIVDGLVPIYNRDGTLTTRAEERGVPYSPNVLDRLTVNADGSVTVYYTLSTWSPYQVFLMSSTFTRQRARYSD